ncbi:MAG TPA: hypothetical protein VF324_02375 [Methanobacterium sp.]
MKAENIYSRKITSTEARKGFIMILKNNLSFFPPLGSSFELLNKGSPKTVAVESYPCTCRGPELPHEHYFIRWNGLIAGNKVEIVKYPEEDNLYNLKII